MSNPEPMPEYQPYGHNQATSPRYERPGARSATRRTALITQTVADIAAVFLALWIVLYLLEANHANVFVQFVEGVAGALAWWSQDIFTMDTEWLRVLLNYGLPAVIYLLAGHGIATRVRRL